MLRPGVIALFLIAIISFSIVYTQYRQDSIIRDAYSQVVVVVCKSSYGTGWWVNGQGYAVTAFHVVDGCLNTGNITLVRAPWASKAELVAYDGEHDIALLRAEKPAPWAEGLPLSYEASIGDPVYIVGYPVQLYEEVDEDLVEMSKQPRVASGTISWLSTIKPIFQFDTATDAGNSGGPVVSKENGGVVGLVVYARSGVVSEGYFGLRMDYVAQFLDSNGVSYRVAGDPGLGLLGVGLVLGLVLVMFMWGGRRG